MAPKRCARHRRSPPARGPPWSCRPPAARFGAFLRRYRCCKTTLWELSGHVDAAARATPLDALRTPYRRRKGRVVHDVSPNAKKMAEICGCERSISVIWDASNPHGDISPGQISRTSQHPQSNRSQPQICAIFPKNGTKNERRARPRLSSALPKPSTQRFRGRAHDASRVVRTALPSQHPPSQHLQASSSRSLERKRSSIQAN